MADYRGPFDAAGMTDYLKEDSQVRLLYHMTKRDVMIVHFK